MSLFSSKRPRSRQFRKKVVHTLEESDEGEQQQQENQVSKETENAPVAQNAKKQEATISTTTKLSSAQPTLSFKDDLDDEGEGEELFKVKKTNHSKRVAKMIEKEKRKEKRLKEAAEAAAILKESGSSSEGEESKEPLFSIAHRLGSGVIPDAAMVHAARKKREILRKLGGGVANQDYMAIDSNNSSRESSVVKGKSRLIREDEYDRSDDSDNEEEGPARTFGQRSDPSRQMKVLEALENAESGSDEERFVEEQISKGVSASAPTSHQSAVTTQQQLTMPVDHSYLYPGLTEALPPSSFTAPSPLHPPTHTQDTVTNQMSRLRIPEKLVPITMESLKSRLQNQLRDLKETHQSHTQRLERMETDASTAEREIGELEEHTSSVSIDYQFYQQMRGYIRDLLSCLTQKNTDIDKLEGSLHSVLKERADLLVERRRQDVRDQAEECTMADVTAVAINQTPGAEARQLRSVEREGRRRRRRERRGVGGAMHYDGTSSDDELLETNRMKFSNEIDKVLTQSGGVFTDVIDDFCKLSTIKEKFEGWKFHLPDSYNQAFVSLCLPKIFTPFVRLQLLKWNPLDADCSEELEDMSWFAVLMFYGFREGHELDPNDEDLQLIPQLVEQAVIPKLTALVQSVWDPLSSSQTLRLVSLLQRLMDDFPTVSLEQHATRTLINAASLKLRQAIDNDVYIPLFASKQLENTSSQRYLFYQRQFWSCIKLLGNITQWAGLIDQGVLQEMVFDGLLNRYLLLSLQNCPTSPLSVTKAQTIVSTLPSSWYKDGSVVKRALQGFVRYLVHLADVLHRSAVGQPDVQRASTRRSIQTVTSLLVKVGAGAEATSLAEEHGLSNVPKSN